MMTPKEISQLFTEKGRTLGCAESFTGGLFAQQITSIPGASHFFKGGLITYSTEEKARILGISYDLIDSHGVVSQEIAQEMASHARQLLNVDYCVSFTGNAGPTAMDNKPVGEVYIAVACYDLVVVTKHNLAGSRSEIQNQAVDIACQLLYELLQQKN
ncbi:MAG TPA: CinA family protein [Bacilli bacterium]|nr:CinA family protein [Bacilli bacterium]HPS18601.1 CinA family protein [Bacilli bacterium]